MTCINSIGKGILNDCTEVLGKGLEQDAYIVDRAYIDFVSSTQTGNVISAIVLATGKQAYKVHTRRTDPYTGAKDSGKQTNFGTSIERTFPLIIEGRNAENAALIDQLRDGKYIIIAEKTPKNASITTDKSFIVYGWEQGLKFSTSEHDPYSEDSNGGWVVTMMETDAMSTMLFYHATDYETSKANLEAMLTPAE